MTEPLVMTRGLGKSLGRKTILRDVSVAVSPGSVVGIIGKNGAGKTTLMQVLLGFSPATAGTSQLFGHDSLTLPAAIKGKIGFVPQQDELISLLSGQQHLALSAALHSHWNHALIERLRSTWEVPVDRSVQALSGGERQKLSTLLALGHQPELLVLDEPVTSLDPISRRQFLREMIDMTADRSRTVLLSTHIMSDLERVADVIWIVREGVIVWAGPLDDLKESVVRLAITSRGSLPSVLPLPTALSQRVGGQQASAVVTHWNDQTLARLQTELDAEIQVEPLSLEDIFVEFHA